ncbi:hypothetical protein XBI1_280019 [Xenorhabdus bovienii str. Intermedium]|uniref:Uncharacterized protein n=1 Tax=Xenorhabdus bovienii str. Intermedium TaxID=1379677 RepID=A0A077QKS3_XENBV|nr:hypothetical protein XBI1_280019 [Xenorhabdus bovienii str. Intermedium]
MNQQSHANHRDREVFREVRTPDDDATDQQQDQANTDRPVNAFLPEVILADISGFLIAQHVVNMLRPLNVISVEQVMFEISEKHKDKQKKHHGAGKRVQYPRQLRCTKDIHHPVQRREEES